MQFDVNLMQVMCLTIFWYFMQIFVHDGIDNSIDLGVKCDIYTSCQVSCSDSSLMFARTKVVPIDNILFGIWVVIHISDGIVGVSTIKML